jgi:methionyl-tRNA formyltransferase
LGLGRIYNLIRAVSHPYPGAFTYFQGQKVFVWAAQPIEHGQQYIGRVPGRVVEIKKGKGVVVLTGDGTLLLTQVQVEGAVPKRADEILQSLSSTLG